MKVPGGTLPVAQVQFNALGSAGTGLCRQDAGWASSLERCDVACSEHERQLVRESFLFSYRDDTIFFFLGFVDHLHGLPERYVPLIPAAEDSVQHPPYRYESNVTLVQKGQRAAGDGGLLSKENAARLAISGGTRKEVFELIERQATVHELHRPARRHLILRARLRRQHG